MVDTDNHNNPLLPAKTYRSLSFLFCLACTLNISTFYFGYSMIYFGSIPIETARQVYHISVNPAIASGFINGCVPVGAFFGAVLNSVVLVNKLSRRYKI